YDDHRRVEEVELAGEFHSFVRKPLGTRRFQRAGVVRRLIGGSQRAWSRMRAIASDNHSTQAWRRGERLLPINPSFAETARWKRCVPRGDFHSFCASSIAMGSALSTSSISSCTLPLVQSRLGVWLSYGEPSSFVTRPPASSTMIQPAAVSQAFRPYSQNPSRRPIATYAMSIAAAPNRRTPCACRRNSRQAGRYSFIRSRTS